MGTRDGRYDRSAFAHGLSHHLNHAKPRVFPLPSPSLDPAHPPPALSPAPNPPGGGRPARRAERRRRSRGPVRLRRSERRSCRRRRGCACPGCAPCAASLSFIPWPASHALGRAGTAPSCPAPLGPYQGPVGPLGLSCCGRSTSAFCSCATPMRQSWCRSRSGLRVGENEHLLTRPRQLACAPVSAWQTALSSPVLLLARVAPRCSTWLGLVITCGLLCCTIHKLSVVSTGTAYSADSTLVKSVYAGSATGARRLTPYR